MKEKKTLTAKEVRQLPKDSTFSILGVVSRFNRKKDKHGNPFWDITLMDGSGELEGKVWNSASWWDLRGGERLPIAPLGDNGLVFEGSTVGLQGKVAEFRDQAQYNFSEVYYVDQEKYPPQSFVRRSPQSDERMEAGFRALIAETHEPVRGFLESVFFKHGLWEDFKRWPAAVSIHHAYVGGLLEHSLSVAEAARDMGRHYASVGVPVDMDLLIAGALLHDLGKLESYVLAPIPQMTVAGNTMDHIALGYHRFMSLAEREGLPSALALALGHIIVSHHGRREFGSPVLPATPEALIVSTVDNLDFMLFYWSSQIEGLDSQHDFTDYLPLLERRFWRGSARTAPPQE